MNSGKQFTPYHVFGCAWKIWSNGKPFPLTVKYPPYKCKSFYLQIISILKKFLSSLTLITHAKPKPKDRESYYRWSPDPILDPRPRRSDRTAQTHRRSDCAASASPSSSNPSPMNPTKPTPISPHPSPRPTASLVWSHRSNPSPIWSHRLNFSVVLKPISDEPS